jgi:predicted nucleic acid-binding protein
MRILLDTNAYSDWRRYAKWNRTISSANEVLLPAIVLGELRYGFHGSSKATENESKLAAFLRHPVVRVLSVGESTSKCYAHLKNFLRKQGTLIPENDIWIAALVLEHTAPLVSSDAHFDHLPQVARVSE